MSAFAPLLNMKIVDSIPVGQTGGTTLVSGTGVDTAGWNYAVAVVSVGDTANAPTAQPVVEESDDNSTWTAADIVTWTAVDDTDDVHYLASIPLGGSRLRYLRIAAHPSGATDDLHCFFLLGNANEHPATAAEMGAVELIKV